MCLHRRCAWRNWNWRSTIYPGFVWEWQDTLLLSVMVLGPALFPWLMGTFAGVCVWSKRLGRICAVSFAGGVCSWLLTVGWLGLTLLVVADDQTGLVAFYAGAIAVPLLAGIGLAVWAVRYGKRAERRDALLSAPEIRA